jgi:hypothetical protein
MTLSGIPWRPEWGNSVLFIRVSHTIKLWLLRVVGNSLIMHHLLTSFLSCLFSCTGVCGGHLPNKRLVRYLSYMICFCGDGSQGGFYRLSLGGTCLSSLPGLIALGWKQEHYLISPQDRAERDCSCVPRTKRMGGLVGRDFSFLQEDTESQGC